MIKILLILVINVHLVVLCYGQNLISNGDFEGVGCDSMNCMLFIKRAKWFPTDERAEPLVFSTNNKDTTRIALKSAFGSQKPHKGKVYIGLYNKDYIHTALNKTLEKDKRYCFSMYLSIAEKYARKTEIGVFFAKQIEIGKEITPIAKYKPCLDITLQATDTASWVKLCGNYKAKGGEKFVVIGNFKSVYKNSDNSYIFVDDVSVIPQLNNDFKCCPEEIHAESGDKITLNELLFKSNIVEIENTAYTELDRLADYLKKKQELKIEINGHTDNTGNTQNNIQLSKNRAKAVYSYLINKGIKAERMKYEGYGSALPLFANDSEENKAKNRRVEIVFTK